MGSLFESLKDGIAQQIGMKSQLVQQVLHQQFCQSLVTPKHFSLHAERPELSKCHLLVAINYLHFNHNGKSALECCQRTFKDIQWW